MTLTVGSLFSGIGGLDLGLERAGMEVRWQCEVDPYCARVLAKHWPAVPNLGDIKEVVWSDVERVDLICGGYPGQPFSYAGSRRGEDDERHLWPHMQDALRVLRPRFALLENVPGHLSMGFGRVLGDLAECGYDTEWDCIPAAAVGAPHLRYRVFVVAHAANGRCEDEREPCRVGAAHSGPERDGSSADVADAGRDSARTSRTTGTLIPSVGRKTEVLVAGRGSDVADTEVVAERTRLRTSGPGTERRRRTGDSGGARDNWAVEPDVGRVAHGVPRRVDRLRSLGNAVVPQVAEYIGARILASVA